MAGVEATHYSLVPMRGPHWTSAQEKSIAPDYPFNTPCESPEQFVTQTYLQFLWLPQVRTRPLTLVTFG